MDQSNKRVDLEFLTSLTPSTRLPCSPAPLRFAPAATPAPAATESAAFHPGDGAHPPATPWHLGFLSRDRSRPGQRPPSLSAPCSSALSAPRIFPPARISPPPAPPRPRPRSTVVVPEILGTAFGPVVQGGAGSSRAPVPPPADGGWQTKVSHRPRAAPACVSRPRCRRPARGARVLTAARPPPSSRLPTELYGCCYNCGSEGHISRECTNPTFCVRCHGAGHISCGCTRPRSPSPVEQPPRLPSALRLWAAVDAPSLLASPRRSPSVLPHPPSGPPPPGAVRLWSHVVQEPPAASSKRRALPVFTVHFDLLEGTLPRPELEPMEVTTRGGWRRSWRELCLSQ